MEDELTIEQPGLRIIGEPEAQAKLFEAIAKARAKFKPIPKTKTVSFNKVRFSYAPLEVILECTAPYLSEQDICVLAPLHSKRDMKCITIILAGHGARIESDFEFDISASIGGIKEFGGMRTYLIRYAYSSMLCVSGDDDAEEDTENSPSIKAPAKGPVKKKTSRVTPVKKRATSIHPTNLQSKAIRMLLTGLGVEDQASIRSTLKEVMNITPSELDEDKAEELIKKLTDLYREKVGQEPPEVKE